MRNALVQQVIPRSCRELGQGVIKPVKRGIGNPERMLKWFKSDKGFFFKVINCSALSYKLSH